MYSLLKSIHSFLPYILLSFLIIAIIVFLYKRSSGKEFVKSDKMLALFTLIFTHLQFVMGLILYFLSPLGIAAFSRDDVMSNDTARFYAVEHIFTMLVAVILITVGYSTAKRALTGKVKFNKLIIFYTIGLVFMLAMIPWDVWPSFI